MSITYIHDNEEDSIELDQAEMLPKHIRITNKSKKFNIV